MFEQAVNVGPGTNMTTHTLEILIMLLGAFLLGLWFGWLLWSKYKQKVDALATENASLNASLTTLRTDFGLAQKKLTELETANGLAFSEKLELSAKNLNLSAQLAELKEDLTEVTIENNALEGHLVNATSATPDVPIEIVKSPVDVHIEDLIVAPHAEPVTDHHAQNHIDEVSASAELHAEVTEAAGIDLELPVIIDEFDEVAPESVSHDLNITAEKTVITAPEPVIEEEVTFTTQLPTEVEHTVTEVVAPIVTPEPIAPTVTLATSAVVAEQVTKETMTTTVVEPVLVSTKDDLKVIEGIGPKIEEILFNSHIMTYAQLAGTPVSRIKEILLAQGSRFAVHDPSTWPAQSLLAANEEWENLKAYQNYLNSGKKPD